MIHPHLVRCMAVSVSKRWWQLPPAAAVGYLLALVLAEPTRNAALAALLGAALWAAVLAVSSYLRHRTDWEVRPDPRLWEGRTGKRR